MKCTWWDTETKNKCGLETGIECPPIFIKHQKFNPKVVRIFFESTGLVKEKDFDLLDAFCCNKHLHLWREYLNRSRIASQAAKKRKKLQTQDYEI